VGGIRQFCKLQDEGQSLMRSAMTQLNLFARANHRILKLARTVSDLAGSDAIQSVHLAIEFLVLLPHPCIDNKQQF
jgi:magnesium chelatase family protein